MGQATFISSFPAMVTVFILFNGLETFFFKGQGPILSNYVM